MTSFVLFLIKTTKRKAFKIACFGFIAFLNVSGNAAGTVAVHDYENRLVELNQPAQRIIALAPHIVENLFSLKLQDQIIAAVEYSNYPEAAKSIPRVGGYVSTSIEAIVALHPDLVIAWGSGNKRTTIDKLIELGIPVYLDEPRDLEDIARSIKDYAVLAGAKAHGEKIANNYIEEISVLRNRYQALPKVSALYEVWNSPLQTINGEHLISDVMTLCGAQNIYADSNTLAPVISLESVLERDPDVILASGMDTQRPEWLDEWHKYSNMKAVRNNQLFHIPPDYLQRHTLRILKGANQMCEFIDSARKKQTQKPI